MADVAGINELDRNRFTQGRQLQGVIEWLVSRKRLHELPSLLEKIDREDLVADAQQYVDHRAKEEPEVAPSPGEGAARYPIGGDQPFEGLFKEVPPIGLDRLHEGAKQQLDILGHTLAGVFNRGKRAILTALVNGARVRVVYLDPYGPYSDQLAQVERQIRKDEDFRRKIVDSIERAYAVKRDLGNQLGQLGFDLTREEIEACRRNLQIACSELIAYVCIQRADGMMLVSQYSNSEEPGVQAPTRELAAHVHGGLFKFYAGEFERCWARATPVEEVLSDNGLRADRARVLAHLPEIQQVYQRITPILRNTPRTDRGRSAAVPDGPTPGQGELVHQGLPAPRMIVVLPTTSCPIVCKNCFTWRSDFMKRREMSLPLFASILRQARDWGVGSVELSGGGEPLVHPHAQQLLDAANDARANGDGLTVGVLTNGLPLLENEALADSIVRLTYVRLGFTEHLDDTNREEEQGEFWQALSLLATARAKVGTSVRIGVKLLLTSRNADRIHDRVQRLLKLKDKDGRDVVNHVKVKSIRGDSKPNNDLIRRVEHDLALIRAAYKDTKDLQIDVKSAEVNAMTHKCWISPIMTVVDPDGHVYLCCNFYEEPDQVRIGSLNPDGRDRFVEFWGGRRHLDVIRKVSAERVCNSPYGANCRLVHYQEMVEPYVRYAEALPAPQVSLFPEHSTIV